MAAISDIRAAVAAALQGIPGVQASAYMMSAPTPPHFFVRPGRTTYDQTLQRGIDRYELIVTGIVSLNAGDIGAQQNLEAWRAPTGASSVKAALEADPTLDGVVETLRVESCSDDRVLQLPGAGVGIGCEWTVTAYARGDA